MPVAYAGDAMLRDTLVGAAKQIPTLAILGLLGGLAVWGHWNDWRLPSLEKLTGETKEEAKDVDGPYIQPDTPAAACGLGYVAARLGGPRIIFPSEELV